jgi:DNA-binding NtrC family response regulator
MRDPEVQQMDVSRMGTALIVDDDPNALKVLGAILEEDGYRVMKAPDAAEACAIIDKGDIDALITDLKMAKMDGAELFHYVTERNPDIPVIFLTAYGTVEMAVQAITQGAFYYFIKPPDYDNLRAIVARAVEQRWLKRELDFFKKGLPGDSRYNIIGNTPRMRKIFEAIDAVKDSASSVLICGETGTGKELIARALHYGGSRRDTPFIAVNCAAIPRDLLESELFGYEKGAFTGAVSRRIGRFEEASGGTIFLDEIGELEPVLQAKLLRVLEEREIERLGCNKKIKVDFRLICSTNRTLQKEVRDRNFREDLFYRINVVQIDVPPLRERREDIPLLMTAFVNEFSVREKKTLKLSRNVIEGCQNFSWPGNIRQLKNVIERAVVVSRAGEITVRDLPEDMKSNLQANISDVHIKTLKQMEINVIRQALQNSGGNKSKASRALGISRKAFYKRLKEYAIS